MSPDPAIHPTEFLRWRPLPDTAMQLGRIRVHAQPQDASSGVWYDLHLVVAMSERDGQPHAAPALHLAPRLRRAFDLDALHDRLTTWTGHALPGSFTPLISVADADGFPPPSIETDADQRWDPHELGSLLPLDLLDEDDATRQGALRRILAREPWALLDAANHLASLYPILEDRG